MNKNDHHLCPFYLKNKLEAGVDEAGRGCLAGPVFAAAVILPRDYQNDQLNDSKKLTSKQRYDLREMIQTNARAWAVAEVDVETIDRINILNASILAMHKALEKLSLKPEHLIIDGNRFKPWHNIPHLCIVEGDGLYLSIAAASVLAKTFRDDHLQLLHQEFPEYGWDKNKGYATEHHRTAIRQFGRTKHHRRSFILKSDQLSLSF
jgi:ribonuclease HII